MVDSQVQHLTITGLTNFSNSLLDIYSKRFQLSSKLLIFEQRDLKHSKLCNYNMLLNWLQSQIEPEQVQHCIWAVMEKQLAIGHSLTRFSSNMFTVEMLLSYEDIFTLWSEVNRYSFLWRYRTFFNKWVISLLYYTITEISRDIKLSTTYAHTHKVQHRANIKSNKQSTDVTFTTSRLIRSQYNR